MRLARNGPQIRPGFEDKLLGVVGMENQSEDEREYVARFAGYYSRCMISA
jgi:hypothetical protein